MELPVRTQCTWGFYITPFLPYSMLPKSVKIEVHNTVKLFLIWRGQTRLLITMEKLNRQGSFWGEHEDLRRRKAEENYITISFLICIICTIHQILSKAGYEASMGIIRNLFVLVWKCEWKKGPSNPGKLMQFKWAKILHFRITFLHIISESTSEKRLAKTETI